MKAEKEAGRTRRVVVMMDNAPYHNKKVEKIPTTGSRKGEIAEWLQRKGIPFPDKATKVRDLSKKNHET